MVFTIVDLVVMALGVAALGVWIFLFVKGRQYSDFFSSLDEKTYPLKEIYPIGYAVIEMFHFSFKSKADRTLRKQLEVLYEPKFADYYIRVVYAQKISLAITTAVLSFVLYGLADSVAIVAVGFVFAGVIYYYFGTSTAKRITKRSAVMLSDFSEVVSKLALLTNAGMILREAWEQVAFTGNTDLYLEMQKAIDDMNNGYAEIDAIFSFGLRCMIPEIKKFASTLVQGITKGNSELASMLLEQSKEVWSLKKQTVRRQGEKAASKLMIPLVIMFIGILVMVIIPIFTNLGM